MKGLTFIFSLLLFGFSQQGYSQEILLLKTSGKVVIGDTSQISTPDGYNLFVQNGMLTERVKVAVKSTTDWSDDEWESTPTLKEVQESISKKKHLPDMPSAEVLVAQGYDLMQMDAKIVAQVEWLWQHMIELKAENKALREELEELKSTQAPKSE